MLAGTVLVSQHWPKTRLESDVVAVQHNVSPRRPRLCQKTCTSSLAILSESRTRRVQGTCRAVDFRLGGLQAPPG